MSQAIHIGILSPATPDRPHFKSLASILPAGVSITHEGLSLLGESYQDLVDKSDRIIELVKSFVACHDVRGLMITGGFVTLFNPGLEFKIAEATGLPVAAAIPSAVAALSAFQAKSALLMTPFDAVSDGIIKAHLESLGFKVYLGPAFENRKAGSPLNLGPGELFQLVHATYTSGPAADAIYFQGATMDPLPVIQELENELTVPVITSNSAMIWKLLSTLGLKYSVKGYGKLLAQWPE